MKARTLCFSKNFNCAKILKKLKNLSGAIFARISIQRDDSKRKLNHSADSAYRMESKVLIPDCYKPFAKQISRQDSKKCSGIKHTMLTGKALIDF